MKKYITRYYVANFLALYAVELERDNTSETAIMEPRIVGRKRKYELVFFTFPHERSRLFFAERI